MFQISFETGRRYTFGGKHCTQCGDDRTHLPYLRDCDDDATLARWHHVARLIGRKQVLDDEDLRWVLRVKPVADGVVVEDFTSGVTCEGVLLASTKEMGPLSLAPNRGDVDLRKKQAYLFLTMPELSFVRDGAAQRMMKWVPEPMHGGIYMGKYRVDCEPLFRKQAEKRVFYLALKKAGVNVP